MKPFLAPLADALKDPPPWWSPYLPLAGQLLDSSIPVAASLNALAGNECPVRFVDPSELPAGEAYEAFIARTARVPTRENVHDLLNGLIWLSYPRTKRRLNELQAQAIAARGTAGHRGALRDALTIFDENAGILQAPGALVDALRRRDWSALFVSHRALWTSARLVLFGHALLEKLIQPRKAITTHVWLVEEISDGAVAASLEPEALAAKRFLPLPVLGVPGWWRPNESPDFYDDATVFRRAPDASLKNSAR